MWARKLWSLQKNKPGNTSQTKHQIIGKEHLEIHRALFPMVALHVNQRQRDKESNKNCGKVKQINHCLPWMEGEAEELMYDKDRVKTDKIICEDNRCKMNKKQQKQNARDDNCR